MRLRNELRGPTIPHFTTSINGQPSDFFHTGIIRGEREKTTTVKHKEKSWDNNQEPAGSTAAYVI